VSISLSNIWIVKEILIPFITGVIITGAMEKLDFKSNIELILHLHPGLSKIVVINYNQTSTGKLKKNYYWMQLLKLRIDLAVPIYALWKFNMGEQVIGGGVVSW